VSHTHRPNFGRWLCLGSWAACALGLVREIQARPGAALGVLPWLGLASLLVWAMYWRPCVQVDDGGVHLVNVLRTIDLPWPSIQRIDTKWALILYTAYGSYTAWAAPAPGLRAASQLHPGPRGSMPESAISDGVSVRPGDLPGSSSGDAATSVRRRWEELREAGYLDDPRLEFSRPPLHWHWLTMAGIGVLVLACLASVLR
jgi:hypothetical protein